MLDELSAPALTLNLPGRGGLVGDLLGSHAELGEPVRLTLRQLLRHPFDVDVRPGMWVSVCENPAVVGAAADELGPASSPLVCTDGMPSAAVQILLRTLHGRGVPLRYHGDLDRGGLRIATTVIERFGATP